MSTEYLVYLGYDDGATHHTQDIASSSWVIYTPEGHVVSLGGVCLQPSSNNVAEYSVVIEILCDAISNGIRSLQVCIEWKLVVSQFKWCVPYHGSEFIAKVLMGKIVRKTV